MNNTNEIEEFFKSRHSGDREQLEVIFSKSNGLLIEAPAGYGKTNTMVSKIAYMLLNNEIPNPKKILALTFSVNAAYKIKKDVMNEIPLITKNNYTIINLKNKIFVSNYHGFCRNILNKYGYLIFSDLNNIESFHNIDDSSIEYLTSEVGLEYNKAEFLSKYTDSVKQCNFQYIKDKMDDYNKIIINELLPKKFITFNSILTLIIYLLSNKKNILNFYQLYYQAILVDEYQDTNFLSYWLLSLLITKNINKIFFGDSLQRIYGFIGAVPNIFENSIAVFDLHKITLKQNYRFKSNDSMLLLDRNIRRNAEIPNNPNINVDEYVKVNFTYSSTQKEEALSIISIINSILSSNPSSKIAVIVKIRSNNINCILEHFDANSISYFYGLFTDEDKEYVQFNKFCLSEFSELIRVSNKINSHSLSIFYKNIYKRYKDNNTPLIKGLLELLLIFIEKVISEFKNISNEDKISFIIDSFEFNGLRQFINYLNKNITITTVHGAKGLEWDYAILPDMEAYSFPNYYGLCGQCLTQSSCLFKVTDGNISKYLDELSVFYVGVTRAKKEVFFTASEYQINSYGTNIKRNISCFLKLPGIKIK